MTDTTPLRDKLQSLEFRLVITEDNGLGKGYCGKYFKASYDGNIANPVRTFAFDDEGFCWVVNKEITLSEYGFLGLDNHDEARRMLRVIVFESRQPLKH